MGEVYPHPAAQDPQALEGECEVSRTRRSGPGGQRRNKAETAVVLRHRATGLSVEAGERRSQEENRRVALKRLRLKLATEHRGGGGASPTGAEGEREAAGARAGDGGASPSELWRSRRKEGRISVNPRHEDYPALLAEAMDVICEAGWEVRPAADRLGCTGSQLIKLLKDHPPALEKLNAERRRRGLRALK